MAQKPFKSDLLKRSPSVQQLRNDIRKEFQERLKTSRSNEVCRRRELFNKVLSTVSEHYQKIQKGLLDNVEEVTPEEMLNIMLQVEKELLDDALPVEVDQIANDSYSDLTENLSICSICNIIIKRVNDVPSLLCDNCEKLHFSTNF